jgi:hypothetical protein
VKSSALKEAIAVDVYRRCATDRGNHVQPFPCAVLVRRRADFVYTFEKGEFMLKGLRYSALSALLASVLILLAGPVWAQPAPDGNSVLVHQPTDAGAGGYYSSRLTTMGFTVVQATDAQWTARTTPDFASFRALIIGDPDCGGSPPAGPASNAAVWAAAANGPKLITGTDEFFHLGSGGGTFIQSILQYVTSGGAGQTGAYISLSCYYDSTTPAVPVPLLSGFGTFMTEGNLGCYNNAHIVAIHPALSGSNDATLSNWSCSVHEVFRSFPSASFIPLVIARNITGVGNLTFGDGSNGVPYVLASGGGIVPVGPPSNIPTMSEWAMISLAALLALSAFYYLRRRSR